MTDARLKVDSGDLDDAVEKIEGAEGDLRSIGRQARVDEERRGRRRAEGERRRGLTGPGAAAIGLRGGVAALAALVVVKQVEEIVLELFRGRTVGELITEKVSSVLDSVPVIGLFREIAREEARRETRAIVSRIAADRLRDEATRDLTTPARMREAARAAGGRDRAIGAIQRETDRLREREANRF